ncbi:tyrosine-type recombinase/integrase [Lentibacillus sp. L22]|uniref:tyrosine-type recombinase/integrase n=1 Tax=Lentibacillus TaxID=175304 RepID=UPI003466300E
MKKNDKPQLKKIRFHDPRHTAATDLINKGANIHSTSKRLGHAIIGTTFNI